MNSQKNFYELAKKIFMNSQKNSVQKFDLTYVLQLKQNR
jgi:hypothetical protein